MLIVMYSVMSVSYVWCDSSVGWGGRLSVKLFVVCLVVVGFDVLVIGFDIELVNEVMLSFCVVVFWGEYVLWVFLDEQYDYYEYCDFCEYGILEWFDCFVCEVEFEVVEYGVGDLFDIVEYDGYE